MRHARLFLAATLATLGIAPVAAKEPPPPTAAQLAGAQVYLVMPEHALRPTIPLRLQGTDDERFAASLRTQTAYGVLFGAAMRSEAILALGADRIAERSSDLVVPPYRTMRAAGCLVDDTAALADALAAATPLPVTRVANESGIAAESRAKPRIELTADHTLPPDFAAVVTVVGVKVYSPDLSGAPRDWQEQPAFERELIVVSDRLDPPKSEADKVRLVEAEKARRVEMGYPELVRKANAGDMDARRRANVLRPELERALEEAKSDRWPLVEGAARRGELWAEDGCARVQAALAANRTEAARLLGLLFSGGLPVDAPPDWDWNKWTSVKYPRRTLASDPTEATQRRVYADGPHVLVSRRAGDDVIVDYRFSPLPGDAERIYDRNQAERAKQD